MTAARKSGSRSRADRLLVERGLVESREQAQALIMAGAVHTPAGPVSKAGVFLAGDTPLEVRERLPYVGRGGFKLARALDVWAAPYRIGRNDSGLNGVGADGIGPDGIELDGVVALDVGASTGGFTDCLLQKGAARVYAVDVGYGQLHYRLRRDCRVICMEKINARHPFALPEPVDLLTIDVSFISLTLALPEPLTHLRAGGYAIALVKPQFEARRGEVGRGGVIRSDALRKEILLRAQSWLSERQEVRLLDTIESPITGDAGNREFLALLRKE